MKRSSAGICPPFSCRGLRVLLVALTLGFAQEPANAQAGKSGFAVLKLGVSGEAIGMADAMTARSSGAASTYYNPAGLLGGDKETEVLLMHKEWIEGSSTEFLGAAVPLSSEHALGVSVNLTSVSDVEIRTRPGPAEGTFSAKTFAGGVSYAQGFGSGIRAGITARFLYEKIFVDEALGGSFDAGVQVDSLVDRLSLGLTVANVGFTNHLRNEATTLPSLLRVGAAYFLPVPSVETEIGFAGDLVHVFPESASYFGAGAEVRFRNVVSIRTGTHFGETERGLTFGLGIHYGITTFDYAYSQIGLDLGAGHTFSLRLRF